MKSDDILVAVAAVLFVLAGVWLLMSYSGVTGFATDTATVNVTITSTADINFTTDNINFGTGTVDSGTAQAVLDTSQNSKTNGTTFTANSVGLLLRNIGNVNATIRLAGGSAATFIGGTSPAYKFNVSNTGTGAKAGSCVANESATQGDWTDVNSTAPGSEICSPLSNDAAADTVRIDIQLTIPKDSKTGALGDVLTATATSV